MYLQEMHAGDAVQKTRSRMRVPERINKLSAETVGDEDE